MKWTKGCFAILSNQHQQILLIKRKDYPLWDLPGGRCEENETHIECVIREVKEETGYDMKVEDMVCECIRPVMQDTQIVFTGTVCGGEAIHDGEETRELRWFTHIPWYICMVPNRRYQLQLYRKQKRHIVCTLKDWHPFVRLQWIQRKIKNRKRSRL